MNKTWVNKEKEGLANLIRQNKSEIRNIINSVLYLNSDQKEKILKLTKRSTAELSDACDQIVMELLEAGYTESIKELREQLKTIIDLCKANSMLNKEIKYKDKFYLDSEVKEFDGDIIITDPCYIINDNSTSDWERCDYGSNMEVLGINRYLTHDTLYGDWDCKTFNEKGNILGVFCADAGLVSVFLLDEVLNYNKNFVYDKYTTTLIKDFKGTVQIVVEKNEKRKYGCDYSVHVIGHGINKKTGKPINFRTEQTGY